jgi:hypothetical protein
MFVETSVLTNTAYLIQAQVELFNVYGRIIVNQLFMEAITVFGANITTLLFNFTSSTPVVAVQPMCAASGALTSLAQGLRCVWVGGAVATAAVITATAGISDVISVAPQLIGTRAGVGTIGQLTAAANQTSGTCRFGIMYTPVDEGSYVEAIL